MRTFAVVFATLLCSASAIQLKAEPESEEHHFFNSRDSTDRQLAELNEQIHAAEEDFVKDLQAQKPASFIQVSSGFAPQSEEHHFFDSRDATDRALAEIDDEIHAAEQNFVKDLQPQKPASFLQVDSEPKEHYFDSKDATDRQLKEIDDEIHAAEADFVKDLQSQKPASFLQVDSEPKEHYFDRRDATDRELAEIDNEIHAAEENFVKDMQSQKPASFLQVDSEPKEHYFDRHDATDRELAEIDNEIHAAEENFVQDVSKPTSFLQLSADLEVNDQPENHVDPSASWAADDAKEMALEAKPHDVVFINGLTLEAPKTEADIQEEKDFDKSVVSLKEKAKPKEDEKEAKAEEIKYDEKKFAKDFGSEWKNGDYPSYKETYSKDAFPGRKAVVAAEDSQSDGKPSKGLRGPNVGAYLKHEADGTITR